MSSTTPLPAATLKRRCASAVTSNQARPCSSSMRRACASKCTAMALSASSTARLPSGNCTACTWWLLRWSACRRSHASGAVTSSATAAAAAAAQCRRRWRGRARAPSGECRVAATDATGAGARLRHRRRSCSKARRCPGCASHASKSCMRASLCSPEARNTIQSRACSATGSSARALEGECGLIGWQAVAVGRGGKDGTAVRPMDQDV